MPHADNKKTRLFCVITLGEIGGAQQFLAELVNHLDAGRYDIMVVTGGDGRQDLSARLPRHVAWAVAGSLKRNLHLFNDMRAVRQLRRMMDEFAPDIVFLNSSKAGFVGSLAAHGLRKRMPHVRVVYRIGGWTFNDPWPAYKRRLFRWMEKFSARFKDVIVVNNLRDLELAKHYGIRPRRRLALIHNGTDPYRPMLNRVQARDELTARLEQTGGIRTEFRTVAGCIANFYPAKGLHVLLEAASRLPEVQFAVIGDGPLRNELEREVHERKLEQRVFFIGMLPDARRYLPAFDLLVLPSLKEGFPWSVLEAMSAKIPIVATTVGAVPEILDDEESGLLVPPGDAVRLADAVSRLIGDERLRNEVTLNAHQRLLAHFTLRTMLANYERLFNALRTDAQ